MSDQEPKPQSGWSKPRFSIKQLLRGFGLIVLVGVVVGAIALIVAVSSWINGQ